MTVMADTAARREARRRRILDNSKYRLQKITGHINNDDFPQDERNIKNAEIPSMPTNSEANGILASDTIMQDQSFDSLIDEINANIDADQPSNKSEQIFSASRELMDHVLSGQNVLHKRNSERPYILNNSNQYSTVQSSNMDNSNNLRFPHDGIGSLLGNSERDGSTLNSPTPEQTSLLINVLSSPLIYVALAFVVNIMLVLKLEHLFGTSIFIPFLIIMIGRLCTCKNDDVGQGDNMLVAALILSNCRPDFVKVIQRLKGTFSLFGKISRDLAVYIFTFVLLYTIISCMNNPDDNLSYKNEAEAIFTEDITM